MRAWALTLALLASAPLHASPRVASINMCTDQLLLALADPQEIAGLGPYARDSQLSWMSREAARYPRLSGEAEDLLTLQPTFVLAGRFGKRATREMLKAQGVALIEFDSPHSIDEVKAQIRKVGDLVGHPERAQALVEKIDAAAARARAAARGGARVLAVSRRGWVAGGRSLLSSLLSTVGLQNSADELGLANGGFAALETIVAAAPDLILVAEASPRAEDQGQALLLHPALERLYPPERRLVISDQLTYCGGPMLPAALDEIAEAVARLRK